MTPMMNYVPEEEGDWWGASPAHWSFLQDPSHIVSTVAWETQPHDTTARRRVVSVSYSIRGVTSFAMLRAFGYPGGNIRKTGRH